MSATNWNGVPNASNDHRTVGPHRAHCTCEPADSPSPWCYPDDLCACCHEALGHRMVWLDKNGQEVEQPTGEPGVTTSDLVMTIRSTWLTSPSGRFLHAPHHLTVGLIRSLAEGDETLGPVQMVCGRWMRPLMPGFFTRMAAIRCPACCDRTGVPRGHGSPKNIVEEG